ncbi:Neuronal acetylcholine receptor subunit alpha-10 [Lamellibrachia satsuma]|nr:Neuronal acetylcholine receptor subunit alpha-10 [Lamellibrachia satsuma]
MAVAYLGYRKGEVAYLGYRKGEVAYLGYRKGEDEVNQVLTTNVWLEQEWNDERLVWDPSEYNGLHTLRIPCQRIWLPDIVLYNSADDFTQGFMQSKAMVKYDGTVFWPPPAKLRSTCKIDITFFPFDDQRCLMKFGSWIYDGFQVDLTNRSATVDLANYVFSGEWLLLDITVKRNEVRYACCIEPYPDVTFTIIMRRRTLYYLFNVVFPCLWLSVLSLLGFWLPADSGEKVTLGITVLLAFSVFMLLIAESMPATSEFVPLIGMLV